MLHYCVWHEDDPEGEAYWVLAASCEEARGLVALNVEAARGARDAGKFECQPDDERTPPPGVIRCRLHGTVTVARR